jgi:hypothetical protein
MSAVPPIYTPGTNFATEASQPIVVAGLPGAELDAEFTSIQATLTALRSRLAEIQRDDGNVKNGVVGLNALAAEVVETLGTSGLTARGEWEEETAYAIGDVFGRLGETRLVLIPYTSGASYGSTDTSNTSVLGTPPDAGYVTRDVFSGDGVEDVFELSVLPVYDTNVRIYVDGLFTLAGTDWTLSGSTITFAEPPASGTDNVVVEIGQVSGIETAVIPDETIVTAKLADLAVTAAKIASLAVTTAKLADLAVTAAKIADATITAAKLANGAVTSDKLADVAVVSAKLATGAVTSTKIGAGAVTSDAIAPGVVTTSKMAISAVATDTIANGAITAPKIAADAVETVGIKDANVTTPKIADANVTGAKLSGGQSGSAPVFGARAWAILDCQTNDDKTGTYSQVATTITISVDAHGLRPGHVVFCDFTSGAAVDAEFTVATVIDANSFTVTASSAATSGNVTLKRVTISSSGNISSVTKSATGNFTVNFTVAMPSVNYSMSGSTIGRDQTQADGGICIRANNASGNFTGAAHRKTVDAVTVATSHYGSGFTDMKEVSLVFHA